MTIISQRSGRNPGPGNGGGREAGPESPQLYRFQITLVRRDKPADHKHIKFCPGVLCPLLKYSYTDRAVVYAFSLQEILTKFQHSELCFSGFSLVKI